MLIGKTMKILVDKRELHIGEFSDIVKKLLIFLVKKVI